MSDGVIKDKDPKGPKTFLTPAYLVEVEKGLYGLYRNLEVESADESGKVSREKMKAIGPIGLFREARKGEEEAVVLKTASPVDGHPISLIKAV